MFDNENINKWNNEGYFIGKNIIKMYKNRDFDKKSYNYY